MYRQLLFVKAIIFGGLLFTSFTFADGELEGKYFEKQMTSMSIEIDKDSYFSTNMRFNWDSVSGLKGRYPHRIKYDEGKKAYFVKGVITGSWVLDGYKWDCEYFVNIWMEPSASGEFIDLTVRTPKDIYVPYKKGSCDWSGTYDQYFSFQRKG